MSRTLSDIYNESERIRKKYMKQTEVDNDSKMSIIESIVWTVSEVIHSFEVLMDAFVIDISSLFNGRINGTPAYYANAMLKWQEGDKLEVNEEGTAFGYPTIDETKRTITHVSYQEVYNKEFKDNILILKVATGDKKEISRLTEEQLTAANAYLNQIRFAGVKCHAVSRKGDILVPKLTVFYDGGITKDELYTNIDNALLNMIFNLEFDSVLYVQKVVDAIQAVEHVTDVYMDPEASEEQGVFVARYDDDDMLSPLTKVERKCYMSSGYIKQSSRKDAEKEIPTFREALVLKLESHEIV